MRKIALCLVTFVFIIFVSVIFQSKDKADAQTAPGYGGKGQDDNIEIFRTEKTGRSKPVKPKIQAPYLSMQWWLMIRNRDCHPQEIDPEANFVNDDQLRLGAKVNQQGRLYILLSVQDRQDAILIYPDPRINNGNNLITKNLEVLVPYRCPGKPNKDDRCPASVDPSTDCWWNMTKPYGDKYITLIFSREKINSLESLIKGASADPKGSKDLPSIPLEELNKIKAQSIRQANELRHERIKPSPNEKGYIAANYVTRITNLNRRDNEDIVETITLKHQQEQPRQ